MDLKFIAVGSRPWDYWRRRWGLSILIGRDTLLDTFYDFSALSKKLKRADIPLGDLSTVIISHEHWDHIGGLWDLLKAKPGLSVYLPPQGQEAIKSRVRALGGTIIDAPGPKTLGPSLHVTPDMIGQFGERTIPEQMVVIETAKGLVLIVGCAHPGILNIVRRVKETFGKPVYAVIGGLHLMNDKADTVRACALALRQDGVQQIAPTHCTGWRNERIIAKIFSGGFIPVHEGQVLSF